MMQQEWWLLGGLLFLFTLAMGFVFVPFRRSFRTMFMLLPILLCLVGVMYWQWGAWSLWTNFNQKQASALQMQALLQSVKSPEDLIHKLKLRLQQTPDSARGWYLLGRLYASLGQWSEAHAAYQKAYHLDSKDIQISVNYAQSMWQKNNRQFNEHIRHFLSQILANHPNQPDVLGMLALDAFLGHSYQQAIDYWQRLLALAPKDSDDAKAIQKAIAKAETELLHSQKEHSRGEGS